MESVNVKQVLDVEGIRDQFPILKQEVRPGVPVIYLDSAATSQKPKSVIDSLNDYYEHKNANIHRGIHYLAEESTAAYEDARGRIADFIGASTSREVVFTRNTTESINLVAYSWGRSNLQKGDVIILTEMEHHSNLIPWQILAAERGIRLEFIPVTDDGRLDLDVYNHLLELEPRLVAFTHMSNMLGTINPVWEMTTLAHKTGAIVLIDAAQSVPHLPVNVQDLDIDFLAFSAHKMCGPTGIGVLYGREALLDAMPPFLGGGDMIRRVYLREYRPNDLPYKFEAGTPAISQGIGFGAAVDFLDEVGLDKIHLYEQQIVGYAMEKLEEVPGVRVYGPPAEERGGVVSFAMDGIHPHDIAQILDTVGIAVRAGHHCVMPLHDRYQLPASTRASFYLYTAPWEIDRLIEGMYKVKEIFK
ncbi:MAG: SufS family cysteine desulfurase [Anaerolineales bacterium]|nr:SufS family cysteine desulfurase [Anaerolineales bacterium]